ncbi:MAG TPA: hypothetical protein VMN82_04935 [Thermoanaerobaculia bacterium]|nr:hypothetical protein [Thermoanaerobaculia bacterium]
MIADSPTTLEFPLGFDLVSVAPLAKTTLRQKLRQDVRSFQPTRFVVPSAVAEDLVVESIEIDGKEQLQEEVDASVFDELHGPTDAKKHVPSWSVLTSEAVIRVRNKSARKAVAVVAALYGRLPS